MRLSPEMTAKCLELAGVADDTSRACRKAAASIAPGRSTVSWAITLRIPGLVVRSELNERCHWAARASRFKAQERTVGLAFSSANIPTGPAFTNCVVMLTRIGAKQLDDDNLQGAFKAVRDRVAKWLGVDDADDRVKWEYSQRRGKPGIEIRVEGGDQ